MKEKIIRVAPILLIIAIAILSIALIVSVGRMFIGGNNGNSEVTTTEEQDYSSAELLKNEVGRSVRMTVRGPIVSNEEARSYTIEVSPTARTLKVKKGYNGEVLKESSHENTSIAYDEFVYALNRANMMKGTALTGEADDLRGICAGGHVYDFEMIKNGETTKHLWTSTCAGSKGSLLANTKQLQSLFSLQIPEFETIVKDLGVSKL